MNIEIVKGKVLNRADFEAISGIIDKTCYSTADLNTLADTYNRIMQGQFVSKPVCESCRWWLNRLKIWFNNTKNNYETV